MEVNDLEGDGIVDLVLHFDKQALIDAFGLNGDEGKIPLKITWQLLDGDAFEGQDWVRVQGAK